MSEVPFDKVVLSCDENPLFLPFVPLIAKAWQKFFPEVGIELGFVCEVNPETGLPLDSRVYQYMRTMAERSKVNLTFLPLVEGVSPCNLGKVGRLIVAAEQGDAVCLLHDVDSLPLQREYFIKLVEQRKKDTMLCVHVPEVYGGSPYGRFPMAPTTAEGYLFKRIINPENLSYTELINSWKNLQVYDTNESINNKPDPFAGDNIYFSDESLLRVLMNRFREERLSMTTNVVRHVANIHYDWVNSTNVPNGPAWGEWDREALTTGGMIEANLLRPSWVYEEELKEIIDYINED